MGVEDKDIDKTCRTLFIVRLKVHITNVERFWRFNEILKYVLIPKDKYHKTWQDLRCSLRGHVKIHQGPLQPFSFYCQLGHFNLPPITLA